MSRARARGVELDIGGVRPGWFSVQLRDTTVQLIDAPALQVKLDNIAVSLTPWLSLREIELHGGEILLAGAAESIVEQVQQWRAARRGNSEPAASGRARLALRGDGLSLRWSGAEAGAADQVVSGIYFERDEAQRAGFEQAKFQLAAGALEIAQADAEFVSTPDGPALSSATVAQLIGRLSLNPATTGGPAARAADDPAAEEEDAEDPEAALPDSAAAGAAGPPRSGRFAALASVPWERRQVQLGQLRALARRAFAEDASVTLSRVQLELARGDSVLNVGPAPFRLVRKGALISASFTPPAQKDGNQLTVQGRLPLGEAPIEISFEGGPISLATLGVHEGDFGLLGVAQSELTVATRLTLSPQGQLDLAASGRIESLSLQHPALAPDPVEGMDLGWRGQVRLDLARHRLEIKDAGVSVEGVRAELGGSLEANGQDLRVAFKLRVPSTPCQVLLEAA
ncbi:MAG: monofunctional biosynthetic peptidoglycan transglycosylase, partial [Pseudomonadota bacterium]